ncbi:hypothetical protein [Clostridium sp. ZBS15]|uniref:hypothetical protein n=1 Tax=Clostridium sp. ZBS15 TaxID=2949969 RepID=UPI00207A57D9|nr:hypothetical protein [Clostridium sp. ZBS15]
MKKNIILCFIMFITLGLLTSCNKAERSSTGIHYTVEDNVHIYSENYIELYQKALAAMFGSDYEVVEETEIYHQAGDINEDIDKHDIKYIQWTIKYTDVNGGEQEFLLNNSSTLKHQIESYLKEYIGKYYQEQFMNKYFIDIPIVNASSYTYCNLADSTGYTDNDKYEAMEKQVNAYREKLETPEGCINFTNFTMEKAFDICPVYLSIHISLDDRLYDAEKKVEVEKEALQKVEEMRKALINFTDGTVNVDIIVGNLKGNDLYDGKGDWRWHILNGEPITCESILFGENVYESYKGFFW